jgi:hypothetical protein
MHCKGEGFGFLGAQAVPNLFFGENSFFLQNSNEVCKKKLSTIFHQKTY